METQTKSYLFQNKTPNDIQLSYWESQIPGLSTQEYLVVEAGRIISLPISTTQEWIILSPSFERLGKFRTKHLLDASWFWCDDFTLINDTNPLGVNPEEKNIIRLESLD